MAPRVEPQQVDEQLIEALFKLAREGRLPEDFDQFHWADEFGVTVAHVAASHGNLPANFDGWDWATKDGTTVLDLAEKRGHIEPERAAEIRASWNVQKWCAVS